MANVKLVFQGSIESETEEHELVCYSNTNNNIYLQISIPNFDTSFICLDKSTAIKLHRELKKQISFLESEVNNE